ncbi:MAG: GntR family transcriptional regulator [Pseudomonadota bacterium]
MALPFNAAIPLYHQIAHLILMRAQSGDPPGRQLPTEQALCVEFGVSRTTIRQALDVLKRQSLLQSRRGVGTRFVGAPAKPKLVASSGDPLHAELGTRDHIVSLQTVPAPGQVVEFFGQAPGSMLFRLIRVNDLEGTPLSVVISYLPKAMATILTRAALRKPVHEVLWERCGLRQHRSVHKVGVARADEQVASLLKVGLTDPVLHVQSAVYLDDGAPIRWTENYFREDRYQYSAEMIWDKPASAKRPRRAPGKKRGSR